MQTAPPLSPALTLFSEAEEAGIEALKNFKDDGYGCGSSFVTIKGTTAFYREMKKLGYVKRDAYYGMILDTDKRIHARGTLAQEHYNTAFARYLSDHGVHAFNHTYLT